VAKSQSSWWSSQAKKPASTSSVGSLMFRYSARAQSRSRRERSPTKRIPLLSTSTHHNNSGVHSLINSRETAADEVVPEKTEDQIQEEIQAIFRQITASVTFLPVLDGNCTFNVLVYADADSDVPIEWGDSDSKEIKNGEKVQLRSFSTTNHRVDTMVSYRLAD
jgi:hypothetical protein